MMEKEKQINQKLKAELFNSNQTRSDLEQILLDCINEAKKDIQKRKLLQIHSASNSEGGNTLKINTSNSPRNICQAFDSDIDPSRFTHQDKVNILKNFITSDKFLDQIYQITFNRVSAATTRPPTSIKTPSTTKRLTESWKQDLSEANQIYDKFKGFRYTFSAKNFGRKNAQRQDLASTHFKFTSETKNKISQIQGL